MQLRIYWNGHGAFNGDISSHYTTKMFELPKCEDKGQQRRMHMISLEEILNIGVGEGFGKLLHLTLDSSFSGEWCFAARKLYQQFEYKFSLVINSATSRDQPAYFGAYKGLIRKDVTEG